MATVTFQPSGIRTEVAEGTSILDAALHAGVSIQTTCGGKASCHLCKVKIVSGDDAISDMEQAELSALGNVYFITRERLSCQTRLSGNVTVEIPPVQERKKKRHRVRSPARRK